MPYFLLYLVGVILTAVIVRAWQKAELQGPQWQARHVIEAQCAACEPPGGLWTNGYTCVAHGPRKHGFGVYPWSLSMSAAVVYAIAWPTMPLVVGGTVLSQALSKRLARYVERRQLAAMDEAEVDRLVAETLKTL